jgi:hypothetical protein
MVEVLIRLGADQSNTNTFERNALMKAALWGRTKVVQVLLEVTNSRIKKQMTDRARNTALDLFLESAANARERWVRRHAEGLSSERSQKIEPKEARHQIQKLLTGKDDVRLPTQDLDLKKLSTAFYEQSRHGTLLVLERFQATMTNYHGHPGSSKTVACFVSSDTTLAATSGWTERGAASGLGQNTKEVLALAEEIGFRMPVSTLDLFNDLGCQIRGSYHACHAEMKVAVRYLHERGVNLTVDFATSSHPHCEKMSLLRESQASNFKCSLHIARRMAKSPDKSKTWDHELITSRGLDHRRNMQKDCPIHDK